MSRGAVFENVEEESLYALGTEDDERTNLVSTDPELRLEMLEQLADVMVAHTDKARGAAVAGG